MTPLEFTTCIPNEGELSIIELAQENRSDINCIKSLASGLERQRLIRINNGLISATDTLKQERKAGLIPVCQRPANGLLPSTDSTRVFEYIVISGCEQLGEIASGLNLTRRQVSCALEELERRSIVRKKVNRRLFLFTDVSFCLADSESLHAVRSRFAPHVADLNGMKLHITPIDVLVNLAGAFPGLSLNQAAKYLGCDPCQLLCVAKVLDEAKILRLSDRSLKSKLHADPPAVFEQKPQRNFSILHEYAIDVGGQRLDVQIRSCNGETTYFLCQPVFAAPTSALMDWVYESVTPNSWAQINTEADFKAVKKTLNDGISQMIDLKLSFVDEATRKLMAIVLTNQMHLGALEFLLLDTQIEEIKAQGGTCVFIKHIGAKQDWMRTNIVVPEAELERYAKAIARETGQQADVSHPLMDAILHTKDRVNVSMPGTSGGSLVMEIRVFSKRPWNFVRLIKKGTVSCEVMALLWLALQNRLNILLSGEAGSGKTSFITALSLFLPKNDHIISIEDTREIQLPGFFGNWSHMSVLKGNPETSVSASRLLINALRMDPSFILMGEVRSDEDIQTLMSATAMGHPLMSTIHTRDCSTTIKRFMDAKVAANDLANIHLNVILEAVKTRGEPHNSMRKVKEVGEYVVGAQGVEVNRIYRLDMHTGMINRVNEPRLFYQRVMDKIGMNKDEIRQDLDEKRQILSWLVNRDVEDQHTLGMVVQTYYLHPGAVLAAASSNNDVEAFLNDDVTS